MSEQIKKFSQLLLGQTAGKILSDTYARLGELDRVGLVGHLLFLVIGPAKLGRLKSFAVRRSALSEALRDFNEAAIDVWSANGLCLAEWPLNRASMLVVCFYCGCTCHLQPVAAAAAAAASSGSAEVLFDAAIGLHRDSAGSSGRSCSLARLLELAVGQEPVSAAEARRLINDLRRLRAALDDTILHMASSFGFTLNTLRLGIARQFFADKLIGVSSDVFGGSVTSLPSLRPGDIIALAYKHCSPDDLDQFDIMQLIDAALFDGPAIAQQQQQQQQQSASFISNSPQFSPSSILAMTVSVDIAPTLADSDEKCIACRLRTRNRVALPCAHFVSCERCLESAGACQRCRSTVMASLVAYIT